MKVAINSCNWLLRWNDAGNQNKAPSYKKSISFCVRLNVGTNILIISDYPAGFLLQYKCTLWYKRDVHVIVWFSQIKEDKFKVSFRYLPTLFAAGVKKNWIFRRRKSFIPKLSANIFSSSEQTWTIWENIISYQQQFTSATA